MIKELWDLAATQAKAVGGDQNARYVELLEIRIGLVTRLRDAALKKVMDLLMACKASTMFVDEKDPDRGRDRGRDRLDQSLVRSQLRHSPSHEQS